MRWKAIVFFPLFFLAACFLENPAERVGTPTELSYNEWLIDELYYFDDIPPKGTYSTAESLYILLPDIYTRYVPKVNAESAYEQSTTSAIPGSIGLEIGVYSDREFPLYAYRVYARAPAGRAGVPRMANLLELNGKSLSGSEALAIYQTTFDAADSVILRYEADGDTLEARMKKEKVYAPTVFLDTLSQGIRIITLRKFSETTSDAEGTVGELREALEECREVSSIVLDIRGNPGGLVSQCVEAADLFIESGTMISLHQKVFFSDGRARALTKNYTAHRGDPGEKKDIWLFTNKGSASCSEIFEMALIKNNPRVKTFGQTSYGKGIGQTLLKTPAGAQVYITSMMFLDADGDSYHLKGIAPQYPCESADYACFQEMLPLIIQSNSPEEKRIASKSLKKNFLMEENAFDKMKIDFSLEEESNFSGGAFVVEPRIFVRD